MHIASIMGVRVYVFHADVNDLGGGARYGPCCRRKTVTQARMLDVLDVFVGLHFLHSSKGRYVHLTVACLTSIYFCPVSD